MLCRSPKEIRVTTATDEYYRDIIEGLAIYTGSMLQRDVLATLTLHDAPDLGGAFNKNQIASKMWLADALLGAVGPHLGEVTILGGWFGVLAAVLLHDPRFAIGRVVSIDIDPRCAAIAESVNATHVRAGRFAARTADMLELDYEAAAASGAGGGKADLLINTSCEHLAEFGRCHLICCRTSPQTGFAASPSKRMNTIQPAGGSVGEVATITFFFGFPIGEI
jgi:hypothetical protein